MLSVLFVAGIIVAAFVGFNIGGSSTGVAFGPAVGSGTISTVVAAGLMTGFALLGGWTVGRNVIDTMGAEIVERSLFTLETSVIVLLFIGAALLVSNLFGVPASTSMTAVGAIAGLGAARGGLHMAVLGEIVVWWLVAPLLAFWVCAVVGRYLYPYLDHYFAIDQSEGALFVVDRDQGLPRPTIAPGTTRQELLGSLLVVAIACYMAFSAGASNVANAVAPLVGADQLSVDAGVILAGASIGVGAFTIARRTLATVGSGLTDLPLLAALIVEVVSASLITFLSAIGIPASLAVSATMCIVGLGWGRATRTASVRGAMSGTEDATVSVNALAADADEDATVPGIGEEDPSELTASDLFDRSATGRVISLWILTPSLAAAAAYGVFRLLTVIGS